MAEEHTTHDTTPLSVSPTDSLPESHLLSGVLPSNPSPDGERSGDTKETAPASTTASTPAAATPSSGGSNSTTSTKRRESLSNTKLTTRLAEATVIEDVLQCVREYLPRLNSINIATAMFALAKIHKAEGGTPDFFKEPRFLALCNKCEDLLDDFEPRALSNLLWAFAVIAYKPERIVAQSVIVAERKIHEFNSLDLADTLWAYAKLRHHPGHLLKLIVSVTCSHSMEDYLPRHLANTLWAYGTLGFHPGGEVLNRISHEAVRKIWRFKATHLVQMAWAFAVFGMVHYELLSMMAVQTERRIADFTPEALVQITWSYATLDLRCHRLLEVIAGRIDATQLKAGDIANLVWACGRIGCNPGAGKLLESTCGYAVTISEQFNAREVCSTMWGLARLGHNPGRLLDQFANAITNQLATLAPQAICNLIWAYATLDHYAGRLVDAAVYQVQQRLAYFTQNDIYLLTWSLQKFGCDAQLTRLQQITSAVVPIGISPDPLADAFAAISLHEANGPARGQLLQRGLVHSPPLDYRGAYVQRVPQVRPQFPVVDYAPPPDTTFNAFYEAPGEYPIQGVSQPVAAEQSAIPAMENVITIG